MEYPYLSKLLSRKRQQNSADYFIIRGFMNNIICGLQIVDTRAMSCRRELNMQVPQLLVRL